MKTLIECKNEVATKYGYSTWRDVDFYPESENAKTPEPPYFKERLHDEAAELYASQFKPSGVKTEWISVKDRPLYTKDEKGRWVATEDGEGEFLAAVPYYENGKGDQWWVRHCVIQDIDGLCVVGDDWNEPAGWHLEDVEYWLPLPEPPK